MKTLKKKKWRRRKNGEEERRSKRKKKRKKVKKKKEEIEIRYGMCVKVSGARVVVNNNKKCENKII